MIKASVAEIQRLRGTLLREGMATYPLAMQAIAEFRHEAFSIMERVADRRAKAVAQIVGPAKFKRDSHEVDEFIDGSETWLAIYTTTPCSFHLCLSWQDAERHPGALSVFAGIYFDRRSMFEKIDKTLQDRFGAKFKTDDIDWGCYLEQTIGKEQEGQLESVLGKVCDKWLTMLQTVNIRKLIHSN